MAPLLIALQPLGHECRSQRPYAAATGRSLARPRPWRLSLQRCSAGTSRVADSLIMDKRALLGSMAALQAIAVYPALASAPATLCVSQDSEEAAAVCRSTQLTQDQSSQASYSEESSKRKFSTAGGVPVSVLDDEYVKNTLALRAEIQQYASLDVFDKTRVPLIKTLKQDCTQWVSKYARGGSARKESARKMYNAVDAITGHIASNGLAPFPPTKMKGVLNTVETAADFLAQGR